MKVYTIGFTKKSASDFFELLRESGAKRLVDVRLNNLSQLAGFTKKDDLEYFLDKVCRMKYVHLPELAPDERNAGRLPKGTSQLGDLRAPVSRSDGPATHMEEWG